MTTILSSKKALRFDMMIIIIMLTTFVKIPELLAINFTNGELELKNHRDLFVWPFVLGECEGSCGRGRLGFNRRCRSGLDCARHNQETLASAGFDLKFAYCQIPISRGRRYFCYDPTKLILPSVPPSSKPRAQPTKKPSSKPSAQPTKKPSSKPSAQPTKKPSSKPSRKPSGSTKPSLRSGRKRTAKPSSQPSSRSGRNRTAKPSSKPSSQPSPPPKKCFTDTSELRSAASLYNASNTIQTYGNISDWCVGLVTDFSLIFYYQLTFNEDISKWNTSSATDMHYMFGNAISFNRDISKWDVSKVTDMSFMFYNATSFNQDISKWDVSNVTEMGTMFYNATSFNKNISNWDVSNVARMSFMFYYATSFNQDISKWDVSKVTNMNFMFQSATSFNQNLSGWDISRLTSMYLMFYNATSFNQNLCSWNGKCYSTLDSTSAFSNASSCPNQTNPLCGSGPFCYNCN